MSEMDEFEPSREDYINRLYYDPDAEVRQNAVWVLGRYRDDAIIEPLIAALKDESAAVRVRVAEVLGNLKDDRVIDPLIAALKDDDEDVRVQAARSLGHSGKARSISPLIAALEDDAAAVRSQTIEALGNLKATAAAGALVAIMLNEADETVRYWAGRSLAMIGGADVVAALVDALNQTESPVLLMQIIEILAQTGTREQVHALDPFLNHEDEGVSATAEWAAGLLKRKP